MTALAEAIRKLVAGHPVTRDSARAAFDEIMSGDAPEVQIAAFLMGLVMRGEDSNVVTAGAEVLRARGQQLVAPSGAVDTCGTGGDGHGTYNISTAAAIVAAACGVPVAKHGNKAVSSKSGSADVLERLGVVLELPVARVQACLDEIGICFLLAPSFHNAMRHVAPVRHGLGIRTVFNVLGPLSNPAGTRRQVIGVYDPVWLKPLAQTLKRLGSERVWVVHGSDGLDELTVTGATEVAALEADGGIRRFTVTPEDAGLARHPIAELIGGTSNENADALTALLAGAPSAYRDIVLLNAAATLLIADRVHDLRDGAAMAAEAIDSGAARGLLDRWAAFTQRDVADD